MDQRSWNAVTSCAEQPCSSHPSAAAVKVCKRHWLLHCENCVCIEPNCECISLEEPDKLKFKLIIQIKSCPRAPLPAHYRGFRKDPHSVSWAGLMKIFDGMHKAAFPLSCSKCHGKNCVFISLEDFSLYCGRCEERLLPTQRRMTVFFEGNWDKMKEIAHRALPIQLQRIDFYYLSRQHHAGLSRKVLNPSEFITLRSESPPAFLSVSKCS